MFLPRRNNGSRLSWFSRCRFDESTPIFTVDDKRPLDVDSKHVGKTYSSKKNTLKPKINSLCRNSESFEVLGDVWAIL